jgi:MoxR-like ATPase
MNPNNPHKPVINPRSVVAEGGSAALAELLAGTGYIIQEGVLWDLVLAIKAGQPHLIEGVRGSGKTALAEALAMACNLPVFYLQGMEGLTLDEVLYSWDKEGQHQWVRQAMLSGMQLKEARASVWTDDYLMYGEALGAFEFASRTGVVPILIVDEIDKLTDTIEDMLLQLFGRGYAHVPRFGEVGEKDPSRWPVVVLLSNDIRHDLSAPLRSRCVYTYMDMPTAREEVAILRARVPEASADSVKWVVKLLDSIRMIPGIQDKPALREGISILTAFMRDGVRELDEATLRLYASLIVKRRGDRDYLLQSLARVERDVNVPHDEIDVWVAQAFAGTRNLSLVAA